MPAEEAKSNLAMFSLVMFILIQDILKVIVVVLFFKGVDARIGETFS